MFRLDVKCIDIYIDDRSVNMDGNSKNISVIFRNDCGLTIFLKSTNFDMKNINLSNIDSFKDSCDFIITLYACNESSFIIELDTKFMRNDIPNEYCKSESISKTLFTKDEYWLDEIEHTIENDECEYQIDITKLLKVFLDWDDEKHIWYFKYHDNMIFCDYISRLINLSYHELKQINENIEQQIAIEENDNAKA